MRVLFIRPQFLRRKVPLLERKGNISFDCKLGSMLKSFSNLPPEYINICFTDEATKKWANHLQIYTNESIIDGRTGFAIYCPLPVFKSNYGVSYLSSVFTAELWALNEILHLIDFCFEEELIIFDYLITISAVKNLNNLKSNFILNPLVN